MAKTSLADRWREESRVLYRTPESVRKHFRLQRRPGPGFEAKPREGE